MRFKKYIKEMTCYSWDSISQRDIDIRKILMNFLAEKPNPSNEDIHELAKNLELDPYKFEEYIKCCL